jgi:diguanylate cyclase (GGDEF)-like protein
MTADAQNTGQPTPQQRQQRSTLLDRTSLSFRMRLMKGVFVAGIVAFILVTHQALQLQSAATDRLARLGEAQRYADDVGRLNNSLRGDFYSAMLGPGRQSGGARQPLQSWEAEVRRLHDELDQEPKVPLPQSLEKVVVETRARAEEFLLRSEDLMKVAARDSKAVLPLLPAFEERFADLDKKLDSLDMLLSDDIAEAKVDADAARESADRLIFWGAALIIGIGTLLAWTITRSIRRSVRDVSAVARALADGNLDVRYEKAAGHEIGMIGASLNAMARNLALTLQRMRVDAEHERFSKDVTEAFELAESERAVAAVAARAMQTVSTERPMQLLLADAGAVELRQVAQHPTAGSPGCAVRSTASCVAIRRGSTVTYADSEQLNACPYLRGRQSATLAATCIPLSFMGKSLGVLHATSPSQTPFDDVVVANLKTLAFAAATRTGTVRAFQRSQLQAMTDSLTGLLNRRALEIEMHDLVRRGAEFSVIVADLDHFKRLNDTLGHQSGDQALRRFGELLKASLRADDRAARWGGEEFVVLLVGTLALQAAEWVDRLRARLASELAQSGQPVFTSSFGIADSSMVRDSVSLLRVADTALYIAKSRGRNRGSIGRPEFALGPDPRQRDKAEVASGEVTTPQLTIARLRAHNEPRG